MGLPALVRRLLGQILRARPPAVRPAADRPVASELALAVLVAEVVNEMLVMVALLQLVGLEAVPKVPLAVAPGLTPSRRPSPTLPLVRAAKRRVTVLAT